MNRPTFFPVMIGKLFPWKTVRSAKIAKHNPARHPHVFGGVAHLSFCSGPLAISRLVIAIKINSFQRFAGRWFSKICQKSGEVTPPRVAHFYTPRPISRILCVVGVVAAAFCVLPGFISAGVATPAATVGPGPVAQNLPVKASAAVGRTAMERAVGYEFDSPTVADAFPLYPVRAADSIRSGRPPSETSSCINFDHNEDAQCYGKSYCQT